MGFVTMRIPVYHSDALQRPVCASTSMLTTTGRIVAVFLGALIGIGVGAGIATISSIWFAPAAGGAIGAAVAYVATGLSK